MDRCTAGLDLASGAHPICIVDARGQIRDSFEVREDAAGLAELVRRLRRYPGTALAIERPEGLLVDTLVDAGIRVMPIQNKLKAACERTAPAAQRAIRGTHTSWPTSCAPTGTASASSPRSRKPRVR